MGRAAVLVTLLVGACASRAAEKLEQPREIVREPEEDTSEPTPVPQARAAVARKESRIDVISSPPPPPDPKIAEAMAALDVHDYERWPLSANQHPALEPAYPIAKVYAQPGVSWLDLCSRGAQNRRGGGGSFEQLEYLRAWCDVAKREARSAVIRLAPLVRSTVLGMPAAVRLDIANIVVDAGDSDDAAQILSAALVDDVAIFDIVAASFAEVGRTKDAIVFADRAIAAHDTRRPVEHCMRITRRVVLSEPGERSGWIHRLSPFENPFCQSKLNELNCWHAQLCAPYLLDQGVSERSLELGELYRDRPKPSATPKAWIEYAQRAWQFRGARATEELAISAMETALRRMNCEGPGVREIRKLASDIMLSRHDRSFDRRLETIDLALESICAPP
ncbi:MAG: hypothetical protein H0T46_33610 [Deltaproteobacteria bacterium]|nr:hypothetical protein [Deltaproteobacteria bacterium]